MLMVPMFLLSFFHRFCFDIENEAQGMTTENKGSMVRARKELEPWQILNLSFLSKKKLSQGNSWTHEIGNSSYFSIFWSNLVVRPYGLKPRPKDH